jgi:drug/metabolite transporter (DMT)-like permease
MEELGRSIDAYCERTDAGLWSEPLNAATNAAFLIAALAALFLWMRRGGRDAPALLLILAVVAVGLGSFAFHTLATVGASLADVIPIAIFIYGYFLLAMRRFLGLGAVGGLVATAGFLAASVLISRGLGGLVGSSAGYVPALIALVGLGGFLVTRRHPAGEGLIAAGAVFAVSLIARTIDDPFCALLPTGTHFLWHGLNAVVLYVLLATAIRVGPRRAGQADAGEKAR